MSLRSRIVLFINSYHYYRKEYIKYEVVRSILTMCEKRGIGSLGMIRETTLGYQKQNHTLNSSVCQPVLKLKRVKRNRVSLFSVFYVSRSPLFIGVGVGVCVLLLTLFSFVYLIVCLLWNFLDLKIITRKDMYRQKSKC